MEHWARTAEIKKGAKTARRQADKVESREGALEDWTDYDLLWLHLSRVIVDSGDWPIDPWESTNEDVKTAWDQVCSPEQIPELEAKLASEQNEYAQMVTEMALKTAKDKC